MSAAAKPIIRPKYISCVSETSQTETTDIRTTKF